MTGALTSPLCRCASAFGLLVALSACVQQMPAAEDASCRYETLGACDATGTQLLQCADMRWNVVSDCHGPSHCVSDGENISCDTSGNSVGARCAPMSEGKVRCDPDGGTQILRCVDGGLVVAVVCPASLTCVLDPDAGLRCQ